MRVRPLDGGAFSPIAAFVVLLVVLAGGTAFVLTRPEPAQPTATTTPHGSPSPPDHSLTNAEAIARFKELDALRLTSYRKRDVSLLDRVFLPATSPARIARREIQFLERRHLHSRSRFETQKLEVISNDIDRVTLRQRVIIHPRVVTGEGRDVTADPRPKEQTLRWVLAWDGDVWLIADSVVIRSETARS